MKKCKMIRLLAMSLAVIMMLSFTSCDSTEVMNLIDQLMESMGGMTQTPVDTDNGPQNGYVDYTGDGQPDEGGERCDHSLNTNAYYVDSSDPQTMVSKSCSECGAKNVAKAADITYEGLVLFGSEYIFDNLGDGVRAKMRFSQDMKYVRIYPNSEKGDEYVHIFSNPDEPLTNLGPYVAALYRTSHHEQLEFGCEGYGDTVRENKIVGLGNSQAKQDWHFEISKTQKFSGSDKNGEEYGYDGSSLTAFRIDYFNKKRTENDFIDIAFIGFFSSKEAAEEYYQLYLDAYLEKDVEVSETEEETTYELDETTYRGEPETDEVTHLPTETETVETDWYESSDCDTETPTEPIPETEELSTAEPEVETSESTTVPELMGSKGLLFESNYDGTCTLIGLGNCRDIHVVVPETSPEGDLVTKINISEYPDYFDMGDVISITIPDSVGSINTESIEHFRGLVEFIVSENSVYFKVEDGILFSKDGTELVSYPAGRGDRVYYVPDSVKIIKSYAFNANQYIRTIVLPEGLETIEWCAFELCSFLESINIPASVNYIGIRAFVGCTRLYDLSFNEDNEAFAYIDGGIYRREGSALVVYNSYGRELAVLADGVEYIEEWAFIQNDSLTGVYIPKSLNSLNAGAFMFCSNLSDIYYEGSEDEWNEIPLSGEIDSLYSAIIHFNQPRDRFEEPDDSPEVDPDWGLESETVSESETEFVCDHSVMVEGEYVYDNANPQVVCQPCAICGECVEVSSTIYGTYKFSAEEVARATNCQVTLEEENGMQFARFHSIRPTAVEEFAPIFANANEPITNVGQYIAILYRSSVKTYIEVLYDSTYQSVRTSGVAFNASQVDQWCFGVVEIRQHNYYDGTQLTALRIDYFNNGQNGRTEDDYTDVAFIAFFNSEEEAQVYYEDYCNAYLDNWGMGFIPFE